MRWAAGDAIVVTHHIGSIAVPHLVAKDVIDVQITVARLDDRPEAAIQSVGFTLVRPVADHCPPGVSLSAEQLAKRLTARNAKLPPYTFHVNEAHLDNCISWFDPPTPDELS